MKCLVGGRGLGRVCDHITEIELLKAWEGGHYAERVWGEHCTY